MNQGAAYQGGAGEIASVMLSDYRFDLNEVVPGGGQVVRCNAVVRRPGFEDTRLVVELVVENPLIQHALSKRVLGSAPSWVDLVALADAGEAFHDDHAKSFPSPVSGQVVGGLIGNRHDEDYSRTVCFRIGAAGWSQPVWE